MIDQYLSTFRAKFFEIHGYNLTFIPKDVTVDWLKDQLNALEWYGKYQEAVKKAQTISVAQTTKPKVSKRTKAAKSNPFV